MDLDLSGNNLEQIAAVIGGILALSLVLQGAAGGTIMYLTEAIKDAFGISPGKGGLVSVIVGILVGMAMGLVTGLVADAPRDNFAALLAIGFTAGLFMAGGAVRSHKAAGAVNIDSAYGAGYGSAQDDLLNEARNAGYNLGQADALKQAKHDDRMTSTRAAAAQ